MPRLTLHSFSTLDSSSNRFGSRFGVLLFFPGAHARYQSHSRTRISELETEDVDQWERTVDQSPFGSSSSQQNSRESQTRIGQILILVS